MRNAKLCLFASVGVAFFSSQVALAELIGRWWSGWGMGVTEYGFTRDDGNRLLVSCDPHGDTKVSVYIGGRSPKPRSIVTFKVSGQTIKWTSSADGNLATGSHFESSNYYALLNEVRRGSGSLHVAFDGRMIQFPLKGSSGAIPAAPCDSDFGK